MEGAGVNDRIAKLVGASSAEKGERIQSLWSGYAQGELLEGFR